MGTHENLNLYAVLAARFPADRESCCIETIDGRRYSWADVERASARIANLLSGLGLAGGARVAVQVEKSPEALMLYLATLRAGFVYVPLNTAYQAGEVDYFVGDAQPSVVVCAPGSREWIGAIADRHGVARVFTLGEAGDGTLREAAAAQPDTFATVARDADGLACILYTSGTTGRSKGAMLTHGNIVSNARTLHEYWRWREGDVLIHALPIFHIHGLFVAVHGALYNASRMLWLPKFDPDTVLRVMPRATVFMGVPTMYVRLLDDERFGAGAARGMRLFVSGSAPLLPDTFRQFEERTGKRILERYGMSETVMITSNPYDGERVAGTVGLPLPGVEVRVVRERPGHEEGGEATTSDAVGAAPAGAGTVLCGVDEIGSIQVRGPNVFKGYWRMPEKTAEAFTGDGFFRTGDMGRWDARGYLSIVGRSKDLIITGGYNVYPKEIESYLDEMEGVFESAVFGVPHRDFGEAVTAAVVPRSGARLDEARLIAALRERIAAFKVPKRILVVDALPRNTMGKVQKNVLRERYAAAS